jgi:hypothetical protein
MNSTIAHIEKIIPGKDLTNENDGDILIKNENPVRE